MTSRLPMPLRFWQRVEEGDGPDACWLWTGANGSLGYGSWTWVDSHGKHTIGAHRMAYTLAVGPIPDGLQIDHLCRNPRCVNPDHLEPVTAKENIRRAAPFTKAARAERHRLGNCGCTQCEVRRRYRAGEIGPFSWS